MTVLQLEVSCSPSRQTLTHLLQLQVCHSTTRLGVTGLRSYRSVHALTDGQADTGFPRLQNAFRVEISKWFGKQAPTQVVPQVQRKIDAESLSSPLCKQKEVRTPRSWFVTAIFPAAVLSHQWSSGRDSDRGWRPAFPKVASYMS